MLNLDFYYIDCEDKDLRDKMFITELKNYQGYYMGVCWTWAQERSKESIWLSVRGYCTIPWVNQRRRK